MKFFTVLTLGILLLGSSLAQTRIGGVTLTPANRTPAPTAQSYQYDPVPAGMRELHGRITSTSALRLPAGSRITVFVLDVSSKPARSVLNVQFKTTRLSAPYQLIFSPSRIASTHQHAVQAVITGASGKVIYQSAAFALPAQSRAVLDIPVSPR